MQQHSCLCLEGKKDYLGTQPARALGRLLFPREYLISGNLPDIPHTWTSLMQFKCAGLISKACTWKALGRYVSYPPSLGVPDRRSRLKRTGRGQPAL